MISSITPTELAARMAAGESLALIDVREPDECTAGVIVGSVNIPLSTLVSGATSFSTIDPIAPVVTICRSGARSAMVARELADLGYTTLNLTGGMLAWETAGLPVV